MRQHHTAFGRGVCGTCAGMHAFDMFVGLCFLGIRVYTAPHFRGFDIVMAGCWFVLVAPWHRWPSCFQKGLICHMLHACRQQYSFEPLEPPAPRPVGLGLRLVGIVCGLQAWAWDLAVAALAVLEWVSWPSASTAVIGYLGPCIVTLVTLITSLVVLLTVGMTL